VPSVDRVLPWRRSVVPAPTDHLAPVVATFRERHPKADTGLILRAYTVAERAHAGQLRRSGETYISHPLAVAGILAGLGLDDTSIAAALLHDAVEDTALTLEELRADFGPQVSSLVDGVTKLERIRFESRQAQQAATMRKMLISMAKDARVLIIKLADRLHNMRTIAAMPEWKQKRTAEQTLDIYAPLAHRLGMQDVKVQLEDLAFATLHPKFYAEIEHMVATRAPEREIYLAQVLDQVEDRLAELRIVGTVNGRPKHYYSIYEKMVVKGKEFDEIYDLVGIRVLVDRVQDCYAALGTIHHTWKPVQGRFKDYIAMPKFNLYQSLHTTVVGPQGKPLEVQIRTREMHAKAERGIAAHWGYKENASSADIAWIQRIVDRQEDTSDPGEFLEALKLDLEQDEVFVFTPKGKVVTLPTGATPVDFAYAIHTEVGHRCIGAKVNGRLVTLDSKLASGDAVEIFTSKVPVSTGPSRDWLRIAVTPRARSKIRQWFSRERREDAIDNGREEVSKALRKEGLPVQKLASSPQMLQLAESMNYADLDSLHAAVGEGHVAARTVAQRLARELRGGESEDQLPATARLPRRGRRQSVGVHVEGLDDVMVRLSRCCTPVPGDEIVGFVTRGRISVHRADCANSTSLRSNLAAPMVDVEWDKDSTGVFVACIEVKALDRTRLGVEVWKVLTDHHLNVLRSQTETNVADRVSTLRFEFELADTAHLESLVTALKRLDSVYDTYRVLPGKH